MMLGRSLVVVLSVLAFAQAQGVGDGLWRTFAPLALLGEAPPLPLTSSAADTAGWSVMNGGACDPNLGIRYSQVSGGPTKFHPLTAYYTSGGQVAGVGVDVFGSSITSGDLNAGPTNLVDHKFWIPVSSSQWTISVSFRSAGDMCSGANFESTLGEQAVINQGTLDYVIPLTVPEATNAGYSPGSCMKTMGQHWFLSLGSGDSSWAADNLIPVIPMYYPPGDPNGKLFAVFFTTPVVQYGSDMLGAGDWESPFLTGSLMCENLCNSQCHWDGTKYWSTMHIYLNSLWKTATCPGGSGPVGRSCPNGVAAGDMSAWAPSPPPAAGGSDYTEIVSSNEVQTVSPTSTLTAGTLAGVIVGCTVGVLALVVGVVMTMRHRRSANDLVV